MQDDPFLGSVLDFFEDQSSFDEMGSLMPDPKRMPQEPIFGSSNTKANKFSSFASNNQNPKSSIQPQTPQQSTVNNKTPHSQEKQPLFVTNFSTIKKKRTFSAFSLGDDDERSNEEELQELVITSTQNSNNDPFQNPMMEDEDSNQNEEYSMENNSSSGPFQERYNKKARIFPPEEEEDQIEQGEANFRTQKAFPQENESYNRVFEEQNGANDGMNLAFRQNQKTANGCLPISAIPQSYRVIFPYPNFNPVQSKCFDSVFNNDMNIVISAPTGCGKTVIFELAIIRLMEKYYANGNLQSRSSGKHKAVYMGPIKALVQERERDWKEKFGKIGLRCSELTGDSQIEDIHDIADADLILTTPEKWDSVTRKWKDKGMKTFMETIELVLIDEVHLLNENRGAVLEAVVSRMKAMRHSSEMVGKPSSNLRFISLSATIPNINDIAEWLHVDPKGVLEFGDAFRPVQLSISVVGVKNRSGNNFLFDKYLNYKLKTVIEEKSDGKPTIIFCSTRKGAQQTAEFLADEKINFATNSQQIAALKAGSAKIQDNKLKELIIKGIGFHQAGMALNDRKVVENLFLSSHLRVIATTSTLALGVNLPARLVIIKGTQQYKNGVGYEEYSELSILQMIGRAGRPQFDEKGVAVIMTDENNVHLYENVVCRKQQLESNLHNHLMEHLNAEIVLETVTSCSLAVSWMKSTFCYVRMKRNPKIYGFKEGITPEELDDELSRMMHEKIHLLLSHGFIGTGNERNPDAIFSKELGRTMARYYMAFETMKAFSQIENDLEKEEEVLRVVCAAKEFAECQIRKGDKTLLNAINKDKIRYKVKGRVKDLNDKVFILMQTILNQYTVENFNLINNISHISNVAPRVVRAMVEVCKEKGFFKCCKQVLLLHKCLNQKMWPDSKNQTRQIEGIGAKLSTLLENAGVTTLPQVLEANPRRLEAICGRKAPFGTNMLQEVKSIPKYEISATPKPETSSSDSKNVQIEVLLTRTQGGIPKKKSFHVCNLIVGNQDNEIVHFQRINPTEKSTNTTISLKNHPKNKILTLEVINEEYIGFDTSLTQEFACITSKVPPSEAKAAKKEKKQPEAEKKKTESKDKKKAQVSESSSLNPPKKEEPKTSPKKEKTPTVEQNFDELRAKVANDPANQKKLTVFGIQRSNFSNPNDDQKQNNLKDSSFQHPKEVPISNPVSVSKANPQKTNQIFQGNVKNSNSMKKPNLVQTKLNFPIIVKNNLLEQVNNLVSNDQNEKERFAEYFVSGEDIQQKNSISSQNSNNNRFGNTYQKKKEVFGGNQQLFSNSQKPANAFVSASSILLQKPSIAAEEFKIPEMETEYDDNKENCQEFEVEIQAEQQQNQSYEWKPQQKIVQNAVSSSSSSNNNSFKSKYENISSFDDLLNGFGIF